MYMYPTRMTKDPLLKTNETLRSELVDMVTKCLTPVAKKYRYSSVSLESNIRWKPTVLLLGNYSSGKSTLINELLGGQIQATGQAPTDDSFTVISGTTDHLDWPVQVIESRDGKALLNDSEFPFDLLKKHGQRFEHDFHDP